MNSTSESLLIRLKSVNDFQAWSRFVELYTPLIFFWARKTGLQTQDASDLVQDVLALVFQKVPEFRYEPTKSFRGWLRTVTLNKHREHCRKKSLDIVNATQSALGNIPEAAESLWDLNYKQNLITQAMELMKPEFRPETWAALREFVISGRPAAEIAKENGLSVWTLYSAKSRLISRLRDELDGLLE